MILKIGKIFANLQSSFKTWADDSSISGRLNPKPCPAIHEGGGSKLRVLYSNFAVNSDDLLNITWNWGHVSLYDGISK